MNGCGKHFSICAWRMGQHHFESISRATQKTGISLIYGVNACGMILKVVEPLGVGTWMVEADNRSRPLWVIPAPASDLSSCSLVL